MKVRPPASPHGSALTDRELEAQAVRLRKRMLQLIVNAGAGHTGGGLSCMDILNVLYHRILRVSPETFSEPAPRSLRAEQGPLRGGFVHRARRAWLLPGRGSGHGLSLPFAVVGHPTRKIHGVEMNTGALGHGLAICVGMAIAGKFDEAPYRVFTLLGDGELAEGSNWEAAMAAAHYRAGQPGRASSITTRCRSPATPATCAATSRWTRSGRVRLDGARRSTATTTPQLTPPSPSPRRRR